MDYEYATNDPSFTETATSIRLKWRRDSAKRDAKQRYILIAPVANLSVTVKGTISFRCEKPKEIRSDKSFEMSRIPSHFHIKIHKRSRIGFLNNSYK